MCVRKWCLAVLCCVVLAVAGCGDPHAAGYERGHEAVTESFAALRHQGELNHSVDEGYSPEDMLGSFFMTMAGMEPGALAREFKDESGGDPEWAKGFQAGVVKALEEVQ